MPPPQSLLDRIRKRLAYNGGVGAATIPDELVLAIATEYERAVRAYSGPPLDRENLPALLFPLAGDLGEIPAWLENIATIASAAETTAVDALQAHDNPDAAWNVFLLSQRQRLSPAAQFTLSRQKDEALA